MSKNIHPTLARIYEISGFTKPSQLSKSLNIGASTITNWAKRGVSREGALLASEKFGASADYILKGVNPLIALSSGIDKEALDDHIVIGQQTKYPLVKIKYLDIKASCGPGYSIVILFIGYWMIIYFQDSKLKDTMNQSSILSPILLTWIN